MYRKRRRAHGCGNDRQPHTINENFRKILFVREILFSFLFSPHSCVSILYGITTCSTRFRTTVYTFNCFHIISRLFFIQSFFNWKKNDERTRRITIDAAALTCSRVSVCDFHFTLMYVIPFQLSLSSERHGILLSKRDPLHAHF